MLFTFPFLLQLPLPASNDVSSIIVYILVAAITGLGTLGGWYIKTLQEIIKQRDEDIKSKDDNIAKLHYDILAIQEKNLDRAIESSQMLHTSTSLLSNLNPQIKIQIEEVKESVTNSAKDVMNFLKTFKNG